VPRDAGFHEQGVPRLCGVCSNVCEDKAPDCHNWAMDGQCESNPGTMLTQCPSSCGLCAKIEKFYTVAIDGEDKEEL